MSIKKLDHIVSLVKAREKLKLVIAYGEDRNTIEAASRAASEGLADIIITGSKKVINKTATELGIDTSNFELIDIPDEKQATEEATKMVSRGDAHVLMKGLCGTATYLRAILNKEWGLLPEGALLSHVTVFEVPTYHKLLIVSDVAVIPYPTLEQKITILQYCIDVAHKLGIDTPKAALIAPVEKVNPKIQSTVDAAIITKMADRGQIRGAIVDGPMAVDLAISRESVEIKRFRSDVAGDADILIFPNLDSANAFFKSLTHFAGAKLAAIVTGTKAPSILTSRADPAESKYYSMALALAMV